MRYLLERIKADTPLADLFNAYLAGLSTLEIFSTPRESMRACRLAFAKGKGRTAGLAAAQRYYELTVLSNSLHQLYGHIEQANALLTAFFTDYGGDLLAYAKATRRRLLNEYGGGEEADWHHAGPGNPDAGEGWEVTDTDDPARLAEYSLHRELGRFFPGPESQGEYIGTSGPMDYGYFTLLVEHQTDFAPRKMFAAVGWAEMPVYRQEEGGEMVPVPVIDQIEQELNEDIENERITAYFNGVLNAGQHLAELYTTMPPNDLTGYRLLREALGSMLAVQMEAYPPF